MFAMARRSLEERPELDPGDGALAEDVVGVVQHRVVEKERRDREGERSEEPQARDPCRPLS